MAPKSRIRHTRSNALTRIAIEASLSLWLLLHGAVLVVVCALAMLTPMLLTTAPAPAKLDTASNEPTGCGCGSEPADPSREAPASAMPVYFGTVVAIATPAIVFVVVVSGRRTLRAVDELHATDAERLRESVTTCRRQMLVRASSAPAAEALLRPAALCSAGDQLLRAASDGGAQGEEPSAPPSGTVDSLPGGGDRC